MIDFLIESFFKTILWFMGYTQIIILFNLFLLYQLITWTLNEILNQKEITIEKDNLTDKKKIEMSRELQERLVTPMIEFWNPILKQKEDRIDELKKELEEAFDNEELDRASEIIEQLQMYCPKDANDCLSPNCDC